MAPGSYLQAALPSCQGLTGVPGALPGGGGGWWWCLLRGNCGSYLVWPAVRRACLGGRDTRHEEKRALKKAESLLSPAQSSSSSLFPVKSGREAASREAGSGKEKGKKRRQEKEGRGKRWGGEEKKEGGGSLAFQQLPSLSSYLSCFIIPPTLLRRRTVTSVWKRTTMKAHMLPGSLLI